AAAAASLGFSIHFNELETTLPHPSGQGLDWNGAMHEIIFDADRKDQLKAPSLSDRLSGPAVWSGRRKLLFAVGSSLALWTLIVAVYLLVV
ncbi:MAG: hypothetical protein ACREDZ_08500, partial [Kiloniellales bacterium]